MFELRMNFSTFRIKLYKLFHVALHTHVEGENVSFLAPAGYGGGGEDSGGNIEGNFVSSFSGGKRKGRHTPRFPSSLLGMGRKKFAHFLLCHPLPLPSHFPSLYISSSKTDSFIPSSSLFPLFQVSQKKIRQGEACFNSQNQGGATSNPPLFS